MSKQRGCLLFHKWGCCDAAEFTSAECCGYCFRYRSEEDGRRLQLERELWQESLILMPSASHDIRSLFVAAYLFGIPAILPPSRLAVEMKSEERELQIQEFVLRSRAFMRRID